MTEPKVLFAAFEAVPFIKTGGLGDVGGSLPAALARAGCDVRVILPRLRQIPQEFRDRMVPVCKCTVPLGWRNQYCGIETLGYNGVQYYFVDNEYYFARDGAYGYGDDGERVAFFSKAILECLQHLPGYFPQILHCNDWHTALTPLLLRENYMELEEYRNVKTVFTVHNLKFQGIFGGYALGDILGLQWCKNAADQLRWGDAINYMQGGLYYSDAITTVSPSYAEEICTPSFGEGLDGVFRQRHDVLSGILNGIDTKAYSPLAATVPFSFGSMAGKGACKAAMQQELGLDIRSDVPLLAVVSRLTSQKGMDLLAGCLGRLLQEDVQLAVLGVGEWQYEQLLRNFNAAMPGKVAARLTFDEALSRRIYAGADMLLMPSLFEPCGLSQMIAMENGTVPIVRETGGLKDSVEPYNKYTGTGTGFTFIQADSQTLLDTIFRALEVYRKEPEAWQRLQRQGMTRDFSWKASAEKYVALYRKLLEEPHAAPALAMGTAATA